MFSHGFLRVFYIEAVLLCLLVFLELNLLDAVFWFSCLMFSPSVSGCCCCGATSVPACPSVCSVSAPLAAGMDISHC